MTGAGGTVDEIEQADATTSSKTLTETSVEANGATVEEAVSKALSQLGITRDEAEVEVVSSGSRPVPG